MPRSFRLAGKRMGITVSCNIAKSAQDNATGRPFVWLSAKVEVVATAVGIGLSTLHLTWGDGRIEPLLLALPLSLLLGVVVFRCPRYAPAQIRIVDGAAVDLTLALSVGVSRPIAAAVVTSRGICR